MNNYSNMNYYMPNMQDEFDYFRQISGLPNTTKQNNLNFKNQMNMMPNQATSYQKNNFQTDQKLANKLKMQAGNNMTFNKSDFNQKLNPNNLYDAYEGFIRGNLFPELYNQYKISKPLNIDPMNEQAEMLTYIDAYGFAAHELNLYLDNNPNDRTAIELFKEYTKQKDQILNQYEQKYGPLFVDASTTYPWAWNESPWPWENM